MNNEREFRDNLPNFETKKRKYFSLLAVKLKEAFKLHKSFNLLEKNDKGKRDWGNVSEHCLVVSARTKALSKLIGLSEKTKNDVVLAAGMHDFYKKNQIEKTPKGVALSMDDYIQSEEEADEELTKAGIPQNIIDYVGSTGALPEAIYKIQNILNKGESASEEEIATLALHYIDDFTKGSAWTKPAEVNSQGEKINDLNRRVEDARNNPKYKSIDEEGKKYFDGKTSLDVQETVGEFVEEFLAMRITKLRGIKIDPKDLPTLIDEEIKKEIEKI